MEEVMKLFVFENEINPNSTMMGNSGNYKFANGKYLTNDSNEIKDLNSLGFKSVGEEEVKPAPIAVVINNPVEDEKDTNENIKAVIPKTWTIARMYEYADALGWDIPSDATLGKDIKLFLEQKATEVKE